MVCGNFILPEPASYVFFYAFSNLRNLLYIISIPAEATVTVHMLLPRSAYEEMRQLLSEHRLSKADILMAGIAACSNQKVG